MRRLSESETRRGFLYPPISAHMRYPGLADRPPILPVMRYLEVANRSREREQNAGSRTPRHELIRRRVCRYVRSPQTAKTDHLVAGQGPHVPDIYALLSRR